MLDHRLPNGTNFFVSNRGEAAFMFDEIFGRRCYAPPGWEIDLGGGCIFDVGANIGMASYFFATAWPESPIHAFEPSPRIVEVLKANVARLKLNVTVHPWALGAASGVVTLTEYLDKSTMSGLFADPNEDKGTARTYMLNEGIAAEDADFLLRSAFRSEQTACPMQTISEAIDNVEAETIALLKVDVEKAEEDVLRGLSDEHWPRIQRLIVEVHDADGRLEGLVRMMSARGYRVAFWQDRKLANTRLYNLHATRCE